jgi:hypothetical protein
MQNKLIKIDSVEYGIGCIDIFFTEISTSLMFEQADHGQLSDGLKDSSVSLKYQGNIKEVVAKWIFSKIKDHKYYTNISNNEPSYVISEFNVFCVFLQDVFNDYYWTEKEMKSLYDSVVVTQTKTTHRNSGNNTIGDFMKLQGFSI